MFSVDEYAEALFDEEAFHAILERIRKATGARSFLTGWYDRRGVHAMTCDSGWWSKDALDLYSREYAYRDVWSNALFADWKANVVRDMSTIVADRTVEMSELYNELFRDIGDDTFRALSVSVSSDAGMGALALHRGRDQEPFDPRGINALRQIERPIARLVQMRGRFAVLEQENTTINAAMDQLGHAVLIVDALGRLRNANGAAERMLREGTMLRTDLGVLKATRVQLQRVIDGHIAMLSDAANAGVRAAEVEDADGRTNTILFVRLPAVRQRPLFMIVIKRPPAALARTLLGQAYRLTAAEAEIALHLADGLSVSEIAIARNTSVGTVRLQLARLSEKMGCRRQSEVVRKVAMLGSISTGFE